MPSDTPSEFPVEAYEVSELLNETASQPMDIPPPASDFDYACETCGKELTYGGRGRKPRFCAEHKKNAAQRPAMPRVSRSQKWQQPLAEALTAQFAAIGMIVYTFEQFDGTAIMQGSPALSGSLVAVAETNDGVRRALETLVQTGAWAQVAMSVAAIALPILHHHGKIPAMPFMAGMGVPAS